MKESMLQTVCFQELQDGTGMDKNRSSLEIIAYEGRPVLVFLLMNLYLILQYYSCTATTLSCHFRNIEAELNDGSHLDSLDALGPGRRILKNMHSLVDGQTLKNIVSYFS